MKKKFCLCFLGCILAGLISTSPVTAFSLLSDGDLKNPRDAIEIAWHEDITETNTNLHYGDGGHDHNSNNWVNGNRWHHRHRPRHSNGSHAPIPSAILLLGSGILSLLGIKIRSRKKS